MRTQHLDPSTWEAETGDFCEFEVSLSHFNFQVIYDPFPSLGYSAFGFCYRELISKVTLGLNCLFLHIFIERLRKFMS